MVGLVSACTITLLVLLSIVTINGHINRRRLGRRRNNNNNNNDRDGPLQNQMNLNRNNVTAFISNIDFKYYNP